MKRSLSLLAALLLAVLPLAGCASRKDEVRQAAFRFAERYNTLVTENGYAVYAVTEDDIEIGSNGFSVALVSGLVLAEGTVSDGKLVTLTVSFTESMRNYISGEGENAPGETSANALYLESFVLVAMSDAYETADVEDIAAFVGDVLLPSFSSVQRVGAYKMRSTVSKPDFSDAVSRLDLLS